MRFDTLDGLRGVAALMVLFFHLGPGSPISASAGYLAVDLFFGLSGFVLSHAYEGRLRSGLSLRAFTVLRLVRVYPMALVGAAIGVFLSGKFALSLLLMPNFGGIGALYPANGPLWSLALELIVNVLFGAVIVQVGWRGLALTIAMSGGLLALGISIYGAEPLGPFWDTLGYGLARAIFSFTLGVGMQRLHIAFAVGGRKTLKAWLLPVALFAVLTQVPGGRPGWDIACIFILLPALLWLGTIWHPVVGGGIMRLLGNISFPLYCIHGVVLQGLAAAGQSTRGVWILLLVVAWWLDGRVDRPVRRWLTGRLAARHDAPPGNALALAPGMPAVT